MYFLPLHRVRTRRLGKSGRDNKAKSRFDFPPKMEPKMKTRRVRYEHTTLPENLIITDLVLK